MLSNRFRALVIPTTQTIVTSAIAIAIGMITTTLVLEATMAGRYVAAMAELWRLGVVDAERTE